MDRKKSNELVLKEANLERSLLKTLRQRQLQFLGHVCRHKGLEQLAITGKIEGKLSRVFLCSEILNPTDICQRAKLILFTSPVLKALKMDRFSAKSIFRMLMVVLFALTQYCEAVRPLSGWGFNIVWIKRNRLDLLFINIYWFQVKLYKEQEANVRIAYCTEVITPCHEVRYTKQRNDGSWLANFLLDANGEREFILYFSSVKGGNL
ncbi:hypothetical protein PoB_001161500 [Plakobranchus ocellatus]|uniref:Uncharacterized protein n=1 Tax=Plakobranchus ocellatus TaxID=259542 RepID=A0AAV3YQU0_9GAST|nr:hypothetical protein PoB_001161500 [Plakobranchus ocellatus]